MAMEFNKMKTRRYGFINVPERLIYDFFEVMKQHFFVPHKIEYKVMSRCYYIEAESSLFRELGDDDTIPSYHVLFNKYFSESNVFEGVKEMK
jgi:hypothetical protein